MRTEGTSRERNQALGPGPLTFQRALFTAVPRGRIGNSELRRSWKLIYSNLLRAVPPLQSPSMAMKPCLHTPSAKDLITS